MPPMIELRPELVQGVEQRILLLDEDIGYEVLEAEPTEGYQHACIVRPIAIERPTDLEVRLAVGEQLQHDLSNVFTGPMGTVQRLLYGEIGDLRDVQTGFQSMSAALSIVRNLASQHYDPKDKNTTLESNEGLLKVSARWAGKIVQRIENGTYTFLPPSLRFKITNLGQICEALTDSDDETKDQVLREVENLLGRRKGDRPSPAVGLYVGNTFDDTLRAIAETGEYEHHASGLDRITLLGMQSTLDHLNGVTSALKYLVTDEQRVIASRIYNQFERNIEDVLVSTLRLREEGELNEEDKDELTGVYQTIQKLERHLKAIQQLTDGVKRSEKAKPFNPREILTEIGTYFTGKFNLGFRGGSCTVSGNINDLCTGYGPSMAVLWHNFVSNALDATLKAERQLYVDINLSVTPGNANYRPDSPFVCVSVTDQGTGIPEGILPTIFRPGVTTKAGDGQPHGVGLGLSAAILARTGSYVRVDTAQGQGTCFTTYTPLVYANANMN